MWACRLRRLSRLSRLGRRILNQLLSIRDAYLMGREHLAASGSAEAPIEAEVLLRHVLQLDRAAFYARWDRPISEDAWSWFQRVLGERATGRPVPYIVGQREFMGLTFAVDERVMIPRPETEVLVEVAMQHLKERAPGTGHRAPERPSSIHEARSPEPDARQFVVDVGTGSGCIAIALAHRCSQAKVYAIDVSPEALEVARINAARHGVKGRVEFLPGDLLTPLPSQLAGCIDAIVSNPPYIPLAQRGALPREIRDFEPAVAVFIDGDGLAAHRRLIADAPGWLRRAGWLAMEVGAGQADAVSWGMRDDGRYAHIRVVADYGGTPRVVVGERAASA